MGSKFSNLGIVICLVLIIIPSLSWTAEFTDGLIVYLSFDEGKGKTTKDVSGNKNDGTLEGPLKWEDGKFGKALRFETGAGTWVKVESNKQMNVDKFTFMAWVNIEDWVGGTRQIVGKSIHGGCAGRLQYVYRRCRSSEQWTHPISDQQLASNWELLSPPCSDTSSI